MIYKDLAFALRNLRRNKLLAFINVFGLSIGIGACLVIFLVAHYELSFDRFQPDRDRIYRIYSVSTEPGGMTIPGIATAVPLVIKNHFTGIESLVNFHTHSFNVSVPQNGSAAKDFGSNRRIILTPPDYFNVFNYYHWIVGSPRQSLSEPFRAVLTESQAHLYFGDVDPRTMIGREIRYQDSLKVTVSGIVKDIKEKTDFDFTDFISIETIEKSWLRNEIQMDVWGTTNSSSQCFIKLARGTSREKLEEQLSTIGSFFGEKYHGKKWHTNPTLQSLGDLHFDTKVGIFDYSRSVVGKSTLRTLMMVAALLLLIAAINFINLETAQASRRAKEVGVRKVLGSSRMRLIWRFLSESFILAVLAVALSLLWAELAFRYYSSFLPEGLQLHPIDPTIYWFLLSCMVLVTLLAGLYPAFVLSASKPVLALKNVSSVNFSATRSGFIRKTLTFFQFSVSQVLIVGTIVIGLQLSYMLNKDLGFNPSAVVWVPTPWRDDFQKNFALKNALEQIPEIEALSQGGKSPLRSGYASGGMSFDNGKEVLTNTVHQDYGDTSYIRLYGIELLAGRNFLPSDTSRELLINETYMHALGVSDPRDMIGKFLNNNLVIVGVVKDFHSQPLQHQIEPMAIRYNVGGGFGIKILTPRNKVADLKPALTKIEGAWKKIYPDEKFDFTFVDQEVKRYYETEQRTGTICRVATGIAIFISCLGLFGLSSFTVIQRTKEIGIRKVLGATVNSILVLLSWDFLKLVIIAFIVSVPVAYYLADEWLQEFAYHTDLTAWIFIASGLVSVAVALMTISLRTVDAAKADPVKALRYE